MNKISLYQKYWEGIEKTLDRNFAEYDIFIEPLDHS